ncbi:rhodanese-like domain-containing protein [Rubrivirga marina]|uniref:rhodanese-like domain-containing protein n=1 Tax=Rubrivirga marina TaxID=1196024 RepID=UPI003CCBC40F
MFILVKEAPGAFAPAEAAAAPLAAVASADTVEVPRLSPAEAAAYLKATPESQVLDVRRPAEAALSGRLAAAVLVDVSVPGFGPRALAVLDPARPVVVYCRSGQRAERAAQVLAGLGFADLYNAGGYEALAAAGLPVRPGAR